MAFDRKYVLYGVGALAVAVGGYFIYQRSTGNASAPPAQSTDLSTLYPNMIYGGGGGTTTTSTDTSSNSLVDSLLATQIQQNSNNFTLGEDTLKANTATQQMQIGSTQTIALDTNATQKAVALDTNATNKAIAFNTNAMTQTVALDATATTRYVTDVNANAAIEQSLAGQLSGIAQALSKGTTFSNRKGSNTSTLGAIAGGIGYNNGQITFDVAGSQIFANGGMAGTDQVTAAAQRSQQLATQARL